MQLIRQVDPSHGACITINPAHVSVFFVRTFDATDGPDRAGAVVTAVVPGSNRESKYRLTPLLSRADACRAHAHLTRIVTCRDMPGEIAWDDGQWTLNGAPAADFIHLGS